LRNSFDYCLQANTKRCKKSINQDADRFFIFYSDSGTAHSDATKLQAFGTKGAQYGSATVWTELHNLITGLFSAREDKRELAQQRLQGISTHQKLPAPRVFVQQLQFMVDAGTMGKQEMQDMCTCYSASLPGPDSLLVAAEQAALEAAAAWARSQSFQEQHQQLQTAAAVGSSKCGKPTKLVLPSIAGVQQRRTRDRATQLLRVPALHAAAAQVLQTTAPQAVATRPAAGACNIMAPPNQAAPRLPLQEVTNVLVPVASGTQPTACISSEALVYVKVGDSIQ
jgi:hypothetical protein